ncbi:PREDICTED: serine/arginine repetitive matrix protein 1-like [Papilio polytes]|uniref:serine/arginine repetitive matrix protein 1-like n=1 Tax=Papilio polytes TaxID=76194 RepID=UPI0006762C09|nr:PREDICTED: serine/arginine repetitive matrix protein 1-like [Papilio polytes]
MSSKFYIHGGGRWREIDLKTGCVSGWGPAGFVYVRGGRLEVARRRRVLRALRSLAADSPSAAKANIVLREYVSTPAPSIEFRSKSPVQWKTNRCNDDRYKVLKETSSVGIQCNTTVDAANQVSDTMMSLQHNNANKILPLRRNGRFIKSKSNKVNKKIDKAGRELRGSSRTKELDSEKSDKQESTDKTKKRRQEVKELLIEEEVVEILRRYLKKNNLGVDPKRYDIDDAYKEQVFYKINPLVVVEQCPQIKRMLQSRTEVSENDFMSSLGLQSLKRTNKRQRSESTSTQSIQDNKENESENTRSSQHSKGLKDSMLKKYKSSVKEKQISPQKRKVVLLSSNSDSDFREPQQSCTSRFSPQVNGLHESSSSPLTSPEKEIVTGARDGTKAPSRTIGTRILGTQAAGTRVVEVGGGGRTVYSPLEDQAIISWVQRGDRARLVNGNRLWRDLPPHHAAHTGVSRTWHSLRNRYLRHILPSLAHIAPSALAAALRAAAATGEIKQKRNKQKTGNNSMFAMPRVRSAWAPHRARLLPPHRPSPPPSPSPSPSPPRSGKPSPPRVEKRTARANPPRLTDRKARVSPASGKRSATANNLQIPRRAAKASPQRAGKRTARANSSSPSPQRKAKSSPSRVAKRTAGTSAPGSGKRRARANSSTSASPPAKAKESRSRVEKRAARASSSTSASPPRKAKGRPSRVAKRAARASAPGSERRTARANSSTSASPPRKAKGSQSRVAKRTARTSAPLLANGTARTSAPRVAKRPVRASALHSANRTTRSVSSTSTSSSCSSRALSRNLDSPPRAARRRPRASSSSSGSPEPAASSTHTEDALHAIHTVRERTRLSKRYSELRHRFDDVEESSDETRRGLRPRTPGPPRSDTRGSATQGSDRRDSAGRLRHRPKKRRLYNPEVI